MDTESTAGFKLWYDNDGGSTYFDNKWDNDSGSMYFRTKVDGTAVSALTLHAPGTVCIGPTTPPSLLQVAGATAPKITLSDTDASANQKHWFIESDTGVFAVGTTSDALAASATRPLTISSTGFGTTTLRGLTITGSATSTSDVGWNITTGCYAVNDTCVGGGSASLTGTTGQVAYFSGTDTAVGTSTLSISTASNVGVGTTTPELKFHVAGGTGEFLSGFTGGATSGGSIYGTIAVGATTTSQRGGTGLFGYKTDTADFTKGGLFLANYGDSENTQSLFIQRGGNVGIGTSTPLSRLHVQGTEIASGAFTGTTAGIFKLSGGAYTVSDVVALDFSMSDFPNPLARIAAQTESAGSFLKFGTSNLYASGITNTAMVIDPNGNVGIGDASPDALFEISSSTPGVVDLFNISDNSDGDILTVTGSGNVGIGSTSPANLLSVNSGATPSAGQLQLTSNNLGSLSFLAYAADNQQILFDSEWRGGALVARDTSAARIVKNNDALSFDTVGSLTVGGSVTYQQRLTILSTGNVGIGTSTPAFKLSVKNAVSTAQTSIAYDDSNATNFLTGATGDLVITPSGNDATFVDANLFVCQGAACPTTTATSTAGNLFVENAVTIGSGFSFREIDSTELGLYDASGGLMVIFDSGT